jgi:hypothetical protein
MQEYIKQIFKPIYIYEVHFIKFGSHVRWYLFWAKSDVTINPSEGISALCLIRNTQDGARPVSLPQLAFLITLSSNLILSALVLSQYISSSSLVPADLFLRVPIHFSLRALIPFSTAAISSAVHSIPPCVARSLNSVSTSNETLALSSTDDVLAAKGRKQCSRFIWVSTSLSGRGALHGNSWER